MDILEKVEKIREKTGVSYEEAKLALEQAKGDILDALVYLEAQGKIKDQKSGTYSTKAEPSKEFAQATKTYVTYEKETFDSKCRRFFKWVADLLKKGCENYFVISKNGTEHMSLPVLVLILLIVAFFWIVVPLLVIGLFCGYKYSFRGEITKTSVDINTVCDKASEACDTVKKEFTKE